MVRKVQLYCTVCVCACVCVRVCACVSVRACVCVKGISWLKYDKYTNNFVIFICTVSSSYVKYNRLDLFNALLGDLYLL